MTQEHMHAAERPPALSVGPLGWARANLFNTWYNSVITLVILWAVIQAVPPLINWAFIDAVWGGGEPDACRVEGAGACWSFIGEKYRLILFGLYPFAEQWRPLLVMVLFIGLVVATMRRLLWGRSLIAAWGVSTVVMFALMYGGFLGLPFVANSYWGGLPLTVGLSTIGLVVAFPLGIILALGRRSNMPAVRTLCVVYIELIRGVPLITVLFMASVLFPLFLPTGVTIDKLLRAQVGLILFAAAYLAEVVRGGLQAIPKGQFEAADSLGLGYWSKMRLIILPQALRISIPPLVNTFIGFFKDTTLVIIIGLFDLLNAAKTALTDRAWAGFYMEAYLFCAIIYFAFCFTMSRYSQNLERKLRTGHARR
ncbi:MAG: amino acid ABC transporter permease [Rhodospirillaceae bacterium]|nr:amino acid ABC transporter permease [Rhodospirillaceae bacterium]